MTDQKLQLMIFESFSTLSFYSVNILDLKNKRANTIIDKKLTFLLQFIVIMITIKSDFFSINVINMLS